MRRTIGLLMVGLLLPALAAAAPSVKGSTGNINTPSSDVLRPGQVEVGYYHLNKSDDTVAAFSLGKNVEMGAAFVEVEGESVSAVNIKYALSQEGVLSPGIAVGMEDMGNKSERTLYAVASKSLPKGLRVHVGCGTGMYDGVFFAVEKKLVPLSVGGVFPDTSLIVENDGRHMNYGLRVSLAAGFKMTTGWRDGDGFVGLSYNYY